MSFLPLAANAQYPPLIIGSEIWILLCSSTNLIANHTDTFQPQPSSAYVKGELLYKSIRLKLYNKVLNLAFYLLDKNVSREVVYHGHILMKCV